MANTDDAAQRLREAVIAAAEPWEKDCARPPFTLPEILTMAVVGCDDEGYGGWPHEMPTGLGVSIWIDRGFPYWRRYYEQNELYDVYQCYETPVYLFDKDWATNTLEAGWNVQLSDAQVFLQQAIGEGSQTRFPFLKLPAELRNRIYDLVLSFPPSGVMAVNNSWHGYSCANAFWTRAEASCPAPFDIESWILKAYDEMSADVYNDMYNSLPIPDKINYFIRDLDLDCFHQSCESKLALLLANKEICAEAMPFFYRANTFMFLSVSHLELKVRIMPAGRRKHLRSVAFSYVPEDVSVAVSAFRMLAAIPKLHNIHIDVDEASWSRTQKLQDPASELLNIAGLDVLADLVCNLQEVEFSSRCPTIAAYLQAELQRVKKTAMEDGTEDANGVETEDATEIMKEAAGAQGKAESDSPDGEVD